LNLLRQQQPFTTKPAKQFGAQSEITLLRLISA